MDKTTNSGKFTLSNIPDGFQLVNGLDGQEGRMPFIVPKFMVPAVEHSVAANNLKKENQINYEKCTQPFTKESTPCVTLSGVLHTPPEPPLTDAERLALHSEVCALQAKLGISYKDAAHRLYMTELERLKVSDTVVKYNAYFNGCLNDAFEGISKAHSVSPKST